MKNKDLESILASCRKMEGHWIAWNLKNHKAIDLDVSLDKLHDRLPKDRDLMCIYLVKKDKDG